jgi:hypothetical protein
VRIASSPRRIALLLFLALAACACGGGGSESADTSAADDADGARRKEKPVPEEGKKWSGWRWKGSRQDCFFKVGNECHSSLDAACKAARCKKSTCVHDDSAPANVSCED